MARVSGAEVKEIINTSLTADQVVPFITAANLLVTAKCSGYSDAELKEIERWLAAHFVSVRDPSRSAVLEQKAGSVSQKLQVSKSKLVSSLDATPYGQQVLAMDYNGNLAGLGGGGSVVMRLFGASNDEFED